MVLCAREYRAIAALAGAPPVVLWQLLLMRRAQLQRTRYYGALGTGTPCGKGAGRRTPCGYLAVTVLWCVGHGHTVRKMRWQAHSLWFPGCCS
jgi:hypothetical protein